MARNSSEFTFKFTGKDQSVGRTLDGMERKMGGFGGFVNRWGGRVAAGIAAAFVTDKIIGFGSDLFDLGQQLATWEVKVDTVFGDAAGSVREWADQVNESLGLSDEAVAGMAASMGDLLVPLGATREEAAAQSQTMIELSGALSAWSAGQYDASQVADILTKAQLGERDALKTLGISINQAEVDQRALIVAQEEGRDAVTGLDKAIATQQLILEKSTDAQAAWTDGSFDAIKAQNEMKAAWEDSKAALANVFYPAATAVIDWFVTTALPVLRQVADWVGPRLSEAFDQLRAWWDENGPTIQEWFTRIWEAARTTFTGIWDVISQYGVPALEWVKAEIGDTFDEVGRLTAQVGLGSDAWKVLGAVVGGLVVGVIVTVGAAAKGTGLLFKFLADRVEESKEGFRILRDRLSQVKDRFVDLYNQIKRVWDLISSPPSIPSFGSVTSWVADRIPGNADGGYITRPTVSWLAEGGQPEFVFNAEQMRGLAAHGIALGTNRPTQGGGGVVLNTYITVEGSLLSERDLADAVNTATRRGLIGSGAF